MMFGSIGNRPTVATAVSSRSLASRSTPRNHLGRGRQRIVAELHRARSGVIGLTFKRDLDPGDADDAADDPDGRPAASSTGPCSMCSSR